jgi:uncharacterized protein (DUF58 family)
MLTGPYATFKDLLSVRYRPPIVSTVPPRVMGNQAGIQLSKQRGRGIDFSEVRAYQAGDDIRTIDWRVTARKNKPHTKIFREERERLTLLVVDQTQSMFFGSQARLKSVAAAELAALTAWQALNHNDRVGGVILGNHETALHKPKRSAKAVARFIGDVARLNQALQRGGRGPERPAFADALNQVRRLARTNYRICFISDFEPMGDHWRDVFRALARHNDVSAVRIFDPLEAELPPADTYAVTDGDHRWQFHAGNRRLRERYSARFDAHAAEFERLCEQTKVRHASITTAQPLGAGLVSGWL